jgi:hypothetical protein
MSLSKSSSGSSNFDELENFGLLDDAIANAYERRNITQQDDFLPELSDEEASLVIGGLYTDLSSVNSSTVKSPFKPPIVIGIIAQDPEVLSS